MKKNKLYESSLKFLVPLDLQQTYKVIVGEALKLVSGGAGGSVIVVEKGVMKRAYSSNPSIRSIEPQRNGRTYSAYKNQKIVVLTKEQITSVHPEFANITISSYILIPLVNRGKSIGVLSIYKQRGGNFSADEKKILLDFSVMASMAIRKAQLYKQLHDALSVRDLFISMAAHELRTPVTTMYVYTQLLKKKEDKGEKFNSEWIDNLLSEMERLTKLIDELLQINQIKTGNFRYEFQETDLEKVADKSLKTFRASHKKSKIIFKNETKKKLLVIGDPNKLEQVIINILDNSVKHNERGKPILFFLNANGKEVRMIIEDEGAGISKEDLEKVFEEFYKGSGHTKAGMGLGLYLIKKIVDEHKGKIKIISTLGRGTIVTITLPLLR